MHELSVSSTDLNTVLSILNCHIPDREVWAFGSRVTGSVKPFSNLDLAIIGTEPLPAAVLADLQDAFRESDLPFKVDLVDWAETNENFRHIIKTAYVILKRLPLPPPRALLLPE